MVPKSSPRQAPRAAIASYRRRWPALAFWLFHGPLLAMSVFYFFGLAIAFVGGPTEAYVTFVELDGIGYAPFLWLLFVQPFTTIASGVLYFGVKRKVTVELGRRAHRLRFATGALIVSRANVRGGFVSPVDEDVSRVTLRGGRGLLAAELDLVSHGQTIADLARSVIGGRRLGSLAAPSMVRLLVGLCLGGTLGLFTTSLLLAAIEARSAEFVTAYAMTLPGFGWALGAFVAPTSVSLFLSALVLRPAKLEAGTDGLSVDGAFLPYSRITGVAVRRRRLVVTTTDEGRFTVSSIGATNDRVSAWRDSIQARLGQRDDVALAFPRYEGDPERWAEAVGATATHLGYRENALDVRRLKRALTGIGIDASTRIAAALALRSVGAHRARTTILDAARGLCCEETRAALESIARARHPERAIANALKDCASAA